MRSSLAPGDHTVIDRCCVVVCALDPITAMICNGRDAVIASSITGILLAVAHSVRRRGSEEGLKFIKDAVHEFING